MPFSLRALQVACALSLVFALSSLLLASQASAAPAQPRSVILLSWDGVRFDELDRLIKWRWLNETPPVCPSKRHEPVVPSGCGYFWSCLPNICHFQRVSSRVAPGKSLTRVQHASMLTGMFPDETGIHTNSGTSSVPAGSTIYERLLADLPEPPALGHIGSWIYTVNGILNSARETAIDPEFIMSRGTNDNYTGTATNDRIFELLEDFEFQTKQFFIFAHIKSPDVVGHSVATATNSTPKPLFKPTFDWAS